MKTNQLKPSLTAPAWQPRGVIAALILCFVFVVSSCTAFPTDSGSPELEVRTDDNGLNITNKMDASVYYFAVERELAARINWVAVSTPENEVAPGQARFVEYGNINGFADGKEILLYYWAPIDPASDDIQSLAIITSE